MRQHTISQEHALALLRIESEQQIAMMEEVRVKGLTMIETREKVRSLLGKDLKWRLVSIRIKPRVYNQLIKIALDGNLSKLFKKL